MNHKMLSFLVAPLIVLLSWMSLSIKSGLVAKQEPAGEAELFCTAVDPNVKVVKVEIPKDTLSGLKPVAGKALYVMRDELGARDFLRYLVAMGYSERALAYSIVNRVALDTDLPAVKLTEEDIRGYGHWIGGRTMGLVEYLGLLYALYPKFYLSRVSAGDAFGVSRGPAAANLTVNTNGNRKRGRKFRRDHALRDGWVGLSPRGSFRARDRRPLHDLLGNAPEVVSGRIGGSATEELASMGGSFRGSIALLFGPPGLAGPPGEKVIHPDASVRFVFDREALFPIRK